MTVMRETLRTSSEIKLIALVVNLRIRNPKIPEVEKYDPVSCLPNEIEVANPWTGSWGLRSEAYPCICRSEDRQQKMG